MDSSLSNFELTESIENSGTDSENGSDPLAELEYVSSSNGNKSDEDFDNNLPPTVTLLKHDKTGAKVYLVGTAHFSKESQEDVRKVMQNVKPNIVVLELCQARINILSLDEETLLAEAKNLDTQKIISTIKQNGVYNGLMYLLLLSTSAYLTEQLGMAPGGEFRTAYQEALLIPNCGVHFGDRPLNITLKRSLARLTWFQTFKLAWHMLASRTPVSVEDIEKCKNRDMLEQLLAELSGEYPVFQKVFLDERDIFLTNSLQAAASSKLKPQKTEGASEAAGNSTEPIKVVGVVGIGHVPGITKRWPECQKKYIKDILTVPPPTLTSKLIKYSFKVSFLALGGFIVYKYVPVPKMLKENLHLVANKLTTSVKSTSAFRYSLNQFSA